MISIIITNYNKEKFILKTLNSCKNQIDKNFEIIITDDASTDKSLEIIKKFISKNKKIKIKFLFNKVKKHKNSNLSQLNSINKALKYCNGEYISLLDGDDFFLSNKVKFLNDKSNFENKKVILHSYYYNNKKFTRKNNRHFRKRLFCWPIFPPTSCITIEKNLFKKIFQKLKKNIFLTCYIDFRLALYLSKYNLEDIYYTRKIFTIYNQNDEGIDSKYRKILSLSYWQRKLEAFCLLFIT